MKKVIITLNLDEETEQEDWYSELYMALEERFGTVESIEEEGHGQDT